MPDLLQHFPTTEIIQAPRSKQVEALSSIGQAIDSGAKFIVLEAPVGIGKSGIAKAIANWSQDAAIITPSKALQDQYLTDFEDVRLMKGRNAYPCTFGQPQLNSITVDKLRTGQLVTHHTGMSCSDGPCIGKTNGVREAILDECSQSGECPYNVAIEIAQEHPCVVFNNWSYVFQTYHAGYFEKRKVMILDEAHNTEPFLRSMLSINFTIYREVLDVEVQHFTLTQWLRFLESPEQLKGFDNDGQESVKGRVEKMDKAGEKVYGRKPVVSIYRERGLTKVEFIPVYVGSMAYQLLFNFADIVIFMSGTIYDKRSFCAPLGIPTEEASFVQLESDFPSDKRSVVIPRSGLDLSHKHWSNNLQATIGEIKHIAHHHQDTKGIIHTSSYHMANELVALLGDRFITHDKDTTQQILRDFFKSGEPKVLISPVMGEGVDFKDDRARWQIIVRPAFQTPNDKFVKYMLDNGKWGWYRWRALIVLGQQLGRVVRSSDDYGVTYLLDTRFKKLLNDCRGMLPQWLMGGFVR